MTLKKIKFQTFTDESGSLTPIEIKDFVDWPVARIYYLTDVSSSRGGHCVKEERKIYVCQKGSCKCRFHDGSGWEEFELSGPSDAISMDGDYYRDFTDFEPGTVLMAISSVSYDPNDYIYDLNEFIEWLKRS